MITPEYPQTGNKLENQIILITGAGDGIGKAVAKACAAHGATVILTGRTRRKLEICYDEIAAEKFTEPLIYKLDLLELDDTAAITLAESVYSEFGRLDGLVHNAAILGTLAPYIHFDSKLWHKVFQVNAHAPFVLNKFLHPLLQRSDKASVIFTGSGVGTQGLAYWGAYSASKFANEGMMQTLAQEFFSDKIRVNMIDPGEVRTKMHASAFPAQNPAQITAPEDITDAYIYLLSTDSENLSGCRIMAWQKGTGLEKT